MILYYYIINLFVTCTINIPNSLGEVAQIALDNKRDCVCVQSTGQYADKIIDLFNNQLQNIADTKTPKQYII